MTQGQEDPTSTGLPAYGSISSRISGLENGSVGSLKSLAPAEAKMRGHYSTRQGCSMRAGRAGISTKCPLVCPLIQFWLNC